MTSRAKGSVTDVALFGLLVAVYLLSPVRVMTDTMRYSFIASEIVHHQTIDLNRYRDELGTAAYPLREVEGNLLSYPPWATALFAAPVVLVGDAIRGQRGLGPLADEAASTPFRTMEYQVIAASVVVALSVVLFRRISLMALPLQMKRRTALSLLIAVAYAFGTAAWSTATRSLWMHGPMMFMYLLIIWLALKAQEDHRFIWFIGVPMAMAYAIRPTALALIAPVLVWALFRWRKWAYLIIGGALVVLMPWLAVNHAFYGTLLQDYYSGGRLDPLGDSVPVAAVGTLFSPSRGLFVFSPILLLAVVGIWWMIRIDRFDGLMKALSCAAIFQWLGVVMFDFWWGGHSYGPRLLADVVPILAVLAIPGVLALRDAEGLTRRVGISLGAIAVVASALMHAPGALFRSSVCWNQVYLDNPTPQEASRALWTISDSQAISSWRAALSEDHELSRELDQRRECPPAADQSGRTSELD